MKDHGSGRRQTRTSTRQPRARSVPATPVLMVVPVQESARDGYLSVTDIPHMRSRLQWFPLQTIQTA